MHTADLSDLDLHEGWSDSGASRRMKFTFPVFSGTGRRAPRLSTSRLKNVGDEPMRFVGFDDPIAPIGRRVVGTPLPNEGSLGAAGDGSRAR